MPFPQPAERLDPERALSLPELTEFALRNNPRTREALEARGVEVLEMEFGGGRVSGRGPVCSTLPLIRDEGPKL